MSEAKVVLVTGVSSGIGRAAAEQFAARGHRVFGTARRPDAVDPPRGVEVLPLDVRDDAAAVAVIDRVIRAAGRIDVLVNNAGQVLLGALEETTVAEARALFETNFLGLMRMTNAVLPAMRAQRAGRVVNVSSIVGFLPAPYMGIYAATKHAVEGYSETLDHEVREFGIRVTMVQPGLTRTRLDENGAMAGGLLGAYEAQRKRTVQRLKLGIAHGGDPSIVAAAIVAAALDRAPRLRYPADRQARVLTWLRKLVPASMFGATLRRQFDMEAAR